GSLRRLSLRHLFEQTTHALGLDEPVLGWILRPVYSNVRHGQMVRLENFLMPDYETHEHDVLVIGAGGAGLRAAIEASASKVSVGMVCKSLLGKAHTV